MNTDTPLVSASTLLTSAEQAMAKLRPTIRSIVKSIDNGIIAANSTGKDMYIHDLPTTFECIKVPRADAQILVYSELIQLYTSPQRGFIVKFISGSRPRLALSWKHGITDAEKESRASLIKSHTVCQ